MRISTSLLYQKAVQDMQDNLSQIASLQNAIGTGKKINKPSDGPVEAARSIDLNQAISRLDQFERNRNFADQRLGLIDATLNSIDNSLQRVRELTIQANSGTQTSETRSIIRAEIEQRLEELLDYANARDGNGDFLFSGSKSDTQPFSNSPSGVNYAGDQTALNLQISANRSLQTTVSGYEVFQKIRNGNGDFATNNDPANAGNGIISAGSVVDYSAFTLDEFSIVFTSSTTFDVVNTTTATTVLSAQPYQPDSAINFNGIQVELSGDIQTGDEFTIAPSRHQDIFQTLNNLIATLHIEPVSEAQEGQLLQGLQNAIGEIDQAIGSMLEIRASVGTRQNTIETASRESDSAKLILQRTLSEVEDLDLAEAISSLTFETNALEAVQATFGRVQNLNLFNYL